MSEKKTVKIMNVRKAKSGSLYAKLDSYTDKNGQQRGVTRVRVELADGTKFDLDPETVFYLNDPNDSIDALLKSGKIDEETAEKRRLGVQYVSKEVVVKV